MGRGVKIRNNGSEENMFSSGRDSFENQKKGTCSHVHKNTVIFDLDGLLIDSEIINYRLYCDLTEKYN